MARTRTTIRLTSIAKGNVHHDTTTGDYLLGGSPLGTELTERIVRDGMATHTGEGTRVPVTLTDAGQDARNRR